MGKTFKYISLIAFGVVTVAAMTVWGFPREGLQKDGSYGPPINRSMLRHDYSDPVLSCLADSVRNIISDKDSVLAPFIDKLISLRSGAGGVVSILHIGDSHVQAGYWTARLRELFQSDFGSAGRGLIVPYKLSGGNEPQNYSVKAPRKYFSGKAVGKQSNGQPGFTGTYITFEGSEPEFEIWSKEPFNSVAVFHHELAPLLSAGSNQAGEIKCTLEDTPVSTRIMLSGITDAVRLKGSISMEYDTPTFYGFSLENGEPGVLYHAIGSNSAAFEHISGGTSILSGGASVLAPDLIIISLGTNNCFGGNYRSVYFKDVADGFLKKIRASYPSSAILVTTPLESCWRKRVRGRRAYMPNPNLADASSVLIEVAADNGVASWDMYGAAGGKGANEVWLKKGLVSKDRIHLTQNGYILQGDMLYDAFVKYYNECLLYGRGGVVNVKKELE